MKLLYIVDVKWYVHIFTRHTLCNTICGGQLRPQFDHSFDDGLWSHSCVPQLCLNSQACYSKKLSQPEKTMPWNCEKMNQADNKKKPSGMSVALVLKQRAPRFVQFVVKTPQEVTGTREFWHLGTNSWCTTLWMWTLSLPDTRMLQTRPLSLWAAAFISSDLKENHPDSSVKVLNHPGDRSLRSSERKVCRCVS